MAASQSWPSASSPSPITTYTREGLFLSRRASAMPTPIESPCPREPVTASTPGVIRSGWPCRLPARVFTFPISSLGMTPSSTRAAYWMRTQCPLLRRNRSRHGSFNAWGSKRIFSKYSAATISASEHEPPRCPTLPTPIILTTSALRSHAIFSILRILSGLVIRFPRGAGLPIPAAHAFQPPDCTLDVLLHEGFRQGSVLGLNRIQYPPVIVQAVLCAEQVHDAVHRDLQDVRDDGVDLHDDRVSRRLCQSEMEAQIRLGESAHVVLVSLHGPQGVFQLLCYLRVSRALYHEGHDSLLHDLPVFEDVEDVRRVEGEHGKKGIEEDLPGVFAHVRAPAVPCLQQPEGHQHMQGLPDRDTAHSERLGKGFLRGELCAGRPIPLHDLVPELLENMILHAGALHTG